MTPVIDADRPAPPFTIIERVLQVPPPPVENPASSTVGLWARGPADLVPIATALIGCDAAESTLVFTLDGAARLTGFTRIALGSGNRNVVRVRDVFGAALVSGAHGIVLVHNHPSGNPVPSPDDRRAARRLGRVATVLGVPLLDFVVVTPSGDYDSMASSTGVRRSSRRTTCSRPEPQ